VGSASHADSVSVFASSCLPVMRALSDRVAASFGNRFSRQAVLVESYAAKECGRAQ